MKVDNVPQAASMQALQKTAAESASENSTITAVEKGKLANGVDFTHMTRNELLTWGEQQREMGALSDEAVDAVWAMSLDISGLKMTANGKVENTLSPEQRQLLNNSEKVNFMAFAEERLAFARSEGGNEAFWRQALDMMQHFQGGFTAQA